MTESIMRQNTFTGNYDEKSLRENLIGTVRSSLKAFSHKGANQIRVDMIGDIIMINISGFLTNIEKEFLEKGDDSTRYLLDVIRSDFMEVFLKSHKSDFEASIGRKIIQHTIEGRFCDDDVTFILKYAR